MSVLQRANSPTAADRARWLAELAFALTEARDLLRFMPFDREVPELEARIAAAMVEVDELRRGRWVPAVDRAPLDSTIFMTWRPSLSRG